VIAQYCITRADIPIGLQAAQLIHAARESSVGCPRNPHEYAIALRAPDEHELNALSERLFLAGIRHSRIIENDTPWTGQLMAIGIPPASRRLLKRYLSGLPLLK
jgi:hypothetical protein